MKNVCRGLIKRHRSLGRVRSCFCYAIDWKIPSEDRLSGNDSGTLEFYFHDGTFQLIRIPFVPDINQPTRQFFSLREPPTDLLLARYSYFSLRNLESKLPGKYLLSETRATMHSDAEVRFAFRDPLRPISSVSNRQANNSRDDVNQPIRPRMLAYLISRDFGNLSARVASSCSHRFKKNDRLTKVCVYVLK